MKRRHSNGLIKAAEQGLPEAQGTIGFMYGKKDEKSR